jgi:UDP-glucuronate decarboxylase
MPFLIAGGAGFLGSHLVEKLLDRELDVIVLDNFFTGSRDNLVHLVKNKNLKVIQQSVSDPINIEPEGIFNLASPASPKHYQLNPVETIKTNLLGSINLLEIANLTKCRILQASTSEVYGDPEISPQLESYWGNVNPIGIRACYDEGKRASETLFFDYQRQFGVDVTVSRIFNTYGPRMALNDGRVVSNFVVQALTNSPITLYGDGSQTRSFCFVDDLIQGLLNLFFDPNKFCGPVNLGNPNEISMVELAETIISLTSSKSKLEFQPLPKDDPTQRKPDISLAREKLNWEPKVTLEEGLLETIRYFQTTYSL